MDTSPKGSMDREKLEGRLIGLNRYHGPELFRRVDAILAEFDRLTEEKQDLWMRICNLSDLYNERGKKLSEAEQALERICEPLSSVDARSRQAIAAELRRLVMTGSAATVQRVANYLDSQGKDSQQKPDILSTEATLRRMIEDKCAFCEKPQVTKYVCSQCGEEMGGITDDCKPKGICICCGKEINADNLWEHLNFACLPKPKDEEVLRGILDKPVRNLSAKVATDSQLDYYLNGDAIHEIIVKIKEHFQLIPPWKEGE